MANKLKSAYDIVRTILQTEKSTRLANFRQYSFLVSPDANKIEIKNAVEKIYKVDVLKVQTILNPAKLKKVRYQPGYTTEQKKAIVTLKEGQKIEVT